MDINNDYTKILEYTSSLMKTIRLHNSEGQARKDLSDTTALTPDQIIIKREEELALEERANKVDDKLFLLMKEDPIAFQVLSFKFGLNGTPNNLSDREIADIIDIKSEHIPIILERTLSKLKDSLTI